MVLPKYLKTFPSQPDDPPNSKNYAALMDNCFNCFVRNYPIPTKYTNPWDEKATVGIIHQQLSDDQGLIEVEKGITQKGVKYISVITKTFMGQQYGIQYFLRFNYLLDENWSEEIDAFFGEEGTTGERDAFVMVKTGITDIKKWSKDPYDKDYAKGILMNLSEDKQYDGMFPHHPLTECRKMLEFLKEAN